jgi:hypothetical protein
MTTLTLASTNPHDTACDAASERIDEAVATIADAVACVPYDVETLSRHGEAPPPEVSEFLRAVAAAHARFVEATEGR